jgi:hypothetical protein
LSFTAQLGYTKIALALLLRVIFFKNHSRRVYSQQAVAKRSKGFALNLSFSQSWAKHLLDMPTHPG